MNAKLYVFSPARALFSLLCLLAAPAGAAVSEMDATSIMAKNFVIARVPNSEFEATFSLISKDGGERVRKTVGATKLQANGLDQMRMTRFVSPPDVQGVSTLVLEHGESDDNIWIYLPALKKTRRLVSNNKKDSFLGTDFSYADVIGFPARDWTYTLVGEETIDGQACYVISGKPNSDTVKANSGYSKRHEWVQKSNFVTVKAEYWDEAGASLKTSLFKDVRLVEKKLGKWQAYRFETKNVQTGHRTVIQFDKFNVGQSVDEQMFTTRYLEKQ
jgi:hypothetical protein